VRVVRADRPSAAASYRFRNAAAGFAAEARRGAAPGLTRVERPRAHGPALDGRRGSDGRTA
jgi:hypothetical protein